LIRLIEEQVHLTLQDDPNGEPDGADGLSRIGRDSLKAVDLLFRLEEVLDRRLPVEVLAQPGSVEDLADALLRVLDDAPQG
jgi:acyl carrier protein